MERFEAQLIRDALAVNHGDIKSTLEALGIPRKTFYDKLQRHGIDRQEYTGGARWNSGAAAAASSARAGRLRGPARRRPVISDPSEIARVVGPHGLFQRALRSHHE